MYTKMQQAPVIQVCLMLPDVHRVQSDDCQDASELPQYCACFTKGYIQNFPKFLDSPLFDSLGQQPKDH